MEPRVPPTRDRVLQLRGEGHTYREIAAAVGISKQRVGQIVTEAARRAWWDDLKSRHPVENVSGEE